MKTKSLFLLSLLFIIGMVNVSHAGRTPPIQGKSPAEWIDPQIMPRSFKDGVLKCADLISGGHFSYKRKIVNDGRTHQYLVDNYNRPQEVVDAIYDLLEGLHEVFEKHNIPYAMIGGTYLGAIRHHGFIPWDDDGDLAILDADYVRLLNDSQIISALKDKKIGLRKSPFGLQAYPMSENEGVFNFRYYQENNPFSGYKRAFVDLFVLKKHQNSSEDFEYASVASDVCFPNSRILKEEWDHRILMPFGHLKLRGIDPQVSVEESQKREMKPFLNRECGSTCLDYACVGYNHVEMKESEFRDLVPIDFSKCQTDDSGNVTRLLPFAQHSKK